MLLRGPIAQFIGDEFPAPVTARMGGVGGGARIREVARLAIDEWSAGLVRVQKYKT